MKKHSHSYTLCEVTDSPVRRYGKASKALKPFPITDQRFVAACSGCILPVSRSRHERRNLVLFARLSTPRSVANSCVASG